VAPNITGIWVPFNDADYLANCTIGQKCGNNTIAKSTSFLLRPDSTWIKRDLIGNGNCSDVDFMGSLILVVESYGAIILDLDADNDSFPDNFSPQPLTPLSPQPQPVLVPQTVPGPQPETNPVPAVNPAPETNPVPAVNPAPESLPISPDVSPAELNPSPFIIGPPLTGIIPNVPSPAPMTPLPVPGPVFFLMSLVTSRFGYMLSQ